MGGIVLLDIVLGALVAPPLPALVGAVSPIRPTAYHATDLEQGVRLLFVATALATAIVYGLRVER